MPLTALDYAIMVSYPNVFFIPTYLVMRIARFILIVIENNFIRKYYPCSCSTIDIALKIIDRYEYEWFDYFHGKPKASKETYYIVVSAYVGTNFGQWKVHEFYLQ